MGLIVEKRSGEGLGAALVNGRQRAGEGGGGCGRRILKPLG